MFLRRYAVLVAALAAVMVQSGCRPARYVQEDQHLLVATRIYLNPNEREQPAVTQEDLQFVLKQKPIRKILGVIPFHLGVWNYGNGLNPEKKFGNYLKNTVGEAPVFYDPALLERSRLQIEQHLLNNGYFDARVKAYPLLDRRKAELLFYVYTGPEYRLRTIGYSFEDTSLIREFSNKENTELQRSLLNRGDRFDASEFDREQVRLTNALKDLGYFTFEKIHVSFDLDTNLPAERCDVIIRIRSQRVMDETGGADTVVSKPHRKHRIRSVTINQNFDAGRYAKMRHDSVIFKDLTYTFVGKPYVSTKRLSRNIFLLPGDYFSRSTSNYTYDRIGALNNYRFIDIRYDQVNLGARDPELDMTINLTHASRQMINVEWVGTNRSGNLGLTSAVNYRNKNFLGGAEQLDWRVYGGLEAQRTNSTVGQTTALGLKVTWFNTLEFGTTVGLTVPDLMLLPRFSKVPIFKEPKTTLSVALDRQFRPQYDRALINVGYQYTVKLSKRDQLIMAPADVSVINLDKSAEFERILQQTGNSLLINSYRNHIIAAGRVSYTYNTQDLKNPMRNYFYTRVNLESAGFLLRQFARTFDFPYVDRTDRVRSYLIDGIAFADYIKLDGDYRKYFVLSKNSSYAIRTIAGVAVPRRNLNTIPFERSFFAGGSNGIRAWQARGLGPGGLADTARYSTDQVGDIQLEVSAELRFPLFRSLKGAIFMDVGNIWLLNYDPLRPQAEFRFDRFYKELAIGPGAGVRADLNFFVLRLDVGMQLHDPALPVGERWSFQPKDRTNTYRTEAGFALEDHWKRPRMTANLAINYPF